MASRAAVVVLAPVVVLGGHLMIGLTIVAFCGSRFRSASIIIWPWLQSHVVQRQGPQGLAETGGMSEREVKHDTQHGASVTPHTIDGHTSGASRFLTSTKSRTRFGFPGQVNSESEWKAYQRTLARAVRGFASDARLKILVVSVVSDSLTAVQDFVRNEEILRIEAGNDTFEFALFHMQGTTMFWNRSEWYRNGTQPLLVMNEIGQVCKAAAWLRLQRGTVAKYDYVWFLDGDLRLDLFSWQLYRTVLIHWNPMVSQPSILPKDGLRGRSRSTDWEILRMRDFELDGAFPVVMEVPRTEVMAPMIHTRLWPIVYNRLLKNDNTVVSTVSDTWDAAALWYRLMFNWTGPLLINAAPLIHMDTRSTPSKLEKALHLRKKGRSQCGRGCGHNGYNCRPLSEGPELPLLHECKTCSPLDCLRILSRGIGSFRSVSVNSRSAVVYKERRCSLGKPSNKSFNYASLGREDVPFYLHQEIKKMFNRNEGSPCSQSVPANLPWLPG